MLPIIEYEKLGMNIRTASLDESPCFTTVLPINEYETCADIDREERWSCAEEWVIEEMYVPPIRNVQDRSPEGSSAERMVMSGGCLA